MEEKTSEEKIGAPEEEFKTSAGEEEEVSEKTFKEEKPLKKSEEEKTGEDWKSLLARKEHFKKKSEDLEAKLKEAEVKKPEVIPTDEEWKQKVNFALVHPEVAANEEFMDILLSVARGRSVSLKEAFGLSDMQAAWKSRQEIGRREEGTPEPSSRVVTFGKKPVSELSSEEIKANYPDIIEKILRARRKKETR